MDSVTVASEEISSLSCFADVIPQQERDSLFLTKLIEKQGHPKKKHTYCLRNDTSSRAGCVVICDNEILVILGQASGLWGFPKGHTQPEDKHIHITALRELREETGLRLQRSRLIGKGIRRSGCCYFLVILSPTEKETWPLAPEDTEEVKKISWLKIDQLRKLPVTSHLRDILLQPTRKPICV